MYDFVFMADVITTYVHAIDINVKVSYYAVVILCHGDVYGNVQIHTLLDFSHPFLNILLSIYIFEKLFIFLQRTFGYLIHELGVQE